MLARLQRALVLACLLAGLVLMAWAWRSGWPAWACAALAMAGLLPLAAGLALSFALLRRVVRDGSAPVPTVAQLLRAWARELATSLQVFAWRQPFREHAQPDVPGLPGQMGLLLVPGFACNRALWAPWLARCRALGQPCRALTLEPVFGSIDASVATLDAAVAALQAETGRPVLLVGHSMGGLVIRSWLRHTPGASDRVAGAITIGTPHQGTWLARWAFSRNGRQMRIGSAWLQALAAAEAPTQYPGFTCFYGHCDNIVFPPGQARLPGADNRHLPATAHVQMAFHPAVWAEVQARLRP